MKATSKELAAQLADMEAALEVALRRAERENSTVYLMRVPNVADLPPIQAHSVAKCAAPGCWLAPSLARWQPCSCTPELLPAPPLVGAASGPRACLPQ